MEQMQNELAMRYAEYRKAIERMTMMSDALMRNILKQKECAEYVLQVILQQKDLHVTDVTVQQDYKNLQGRSAVLDCVARDSSDHRFNVEVQQENGGASPKRARYHSGLLDMNTLNPREDFDSLPEAYIIFITRDDTQGSGLPIYHIDRKIEETQTLFHDGSHIIYVNSGIQDDTELGRLMHDFHCRNADDMTSKILAERMRQIKETSKGVEEMCKEMEQIYNNGIEKGIEEGKMKKAKEMAFSLSHMGLPAEQIAEAAKVSVNLVQEWLSGKTGATK